MKYKVGLRNNEGKWEYMTTRLGTPFVEQLFKEFLDNPKLTKISIERIKEDE